MNRSHFIENLLMGVVRALAKETGRFGGILRYTAEDWSYETAKMDKFGL